MVTFKKTNKFSNRGVKAESAMAKFLSVWSGETTYREVNRLVDSKAAGRVIKAAAADFEYFEARWPSDTRHGLIEVKSTEHDYRLARDKLPQLARLRKRTKCGGKCLVAVYHSTLDIWRVVDVEWLLSNGDKGSWNLSDVKWYGALDDAMAGALPEVFG